MNRYYLRTLLLAFLASSSAAAETPVSGEVIYVNGTTIYLNVGRDVGLALGQTVVVHRGSTTLGVLRVQNLAKNRASCTAVDSTVVYEVGDQVTFIPEVTDEPPDSREKLRAQAEREPEENRSEIRGRVGLQVLSLVSQGSEEVTQPAVSLRLDARNLGGKGIEAKVDVRARRTYRTRNQESSSTGLNRVYRLYAAKYLDNGLRLAVGRQSSLDLAAINIFDGLLAEYERGSLRAGGFAGWQPDPQNLGLSSDILEFGAYLGLHQRSGRNRQSATIGWVTSLYQGQTNRDYAFLRLHNVSERVHVFAHQEVDFGRNWEGESTKDAVSFTNTLLNVRYLASSRLTLRTGFNSRKNVRQYRDRETPESEFDDRYRQGMDLGADVSVSSWKLGVTTRFRLGSAGNGARSVTARARTARLGPTAVSLSLRSTMFRTDDSSGHFHSAGLSRQISRKLRGEVHGGVRHESYNRESDDSVWFGTDWSLSVSRGIFYILTLDRTTVGNDTGTQIFSSLSYRF